MSRSLREASPRAAADSSRLHSHLPLRGELDATYAANAAGDAETFLGAGPEHWARRIFVSQFSRWRSEEAGEQKPGQRPEAKQGCDFRFSERREGLLRLAFKGVYLNFLREFLLFPRVHGVIPAIWAVSLSHLSHSRTRGSCKPRPLVRLVRMCPVVLTLKDFRLPVLSVAAMAEWLRRWTWNPMGSPRAGSNPARCGKGRSFFTHFQQMLSYDNRYSSGCISPICPLNGPTAEKLNVSKKSQ